MKYIALLFALLLGTLHSFALSRTSPSPMLHSVLDNAPPSSSFNFANAPAPGAGPDFQHRRYRNFSTSPEEWRRRGIGLTIAGGVVIALGGAGWSASNAESQRQHVNIGDESTILFYIGSAFIAYLGLLLVAVGLPIWIYHINK